jgi:hypothetical protein
MAVADKSQALAPLLEHLLVKDSMAAAAEMIRRGSDFQGSGM